MKLFKVVIVLKDCTHVRHRLKTVPVHQIKVTLVNVMGALGYKWLRIAENPQLSWSSQHNTSINEKYFDIILIKEISSEST